MKPPEVSPKEGFFFFKGILIGTLHCAPHPTHSASWLTHSLIIVTVRGGYYPSQFGYKETESQEGKCPHSSDMVEAGFKPRPVWPKAQLLGTRWQCLKIPPRDVRDRSSHPRSLMTNPQSKEEEDKQNELRIPILVT